MDDAFGNWFAGFVDGEGCFLLSRKSRNKYITPVFDMKLRDDDSEIIYKIRDELGFGEVRSVSCGAVNKQILIRIDSITRCLLLIEIFDKFPLRAKKARDYEIWKRAVLWAYDHLGKRVDRTPMIIFKQELSDIRKYKHP